MLNKFISGYFERLIAVIIEWGGEYVAKRISTCICFCFARMICDFLGCQTTETTCHNSIIKVAGDAMLVVWRNPRAAASSYEAKTDEGADGGRKPRKNMRAMLGSGDETLSTLVLRAVCGKLI